MSLREHRKNVRNLIQAVAAAKTIRMVEDACDSVRADCAAHWATEPDNHLARAAEALFRCLPARGELPRSTLAAQLLVLKRLTNVVSNI